MTDAKNYDSEFCGRVPLNQTNLIQPHGILMLVDKVNWNIIQVSENVADLLGKTAPEVINTPFTDYITPAQKENIQGRFEESRGGRIPFTFSFQQEGGSKDYLALVQAQEQYLMLEIERAAVNAVQNSFINVYGELKYAIAGIDAANTIEEAAAIVAKEIKRISGFDKVMIYRFDEGWNGNVIAEEKEEGMDAYLGLTFPASDIPKGAREMYRANPYRFIPNAAYQPVRLYPVINPLTHAFTDLAASQLRSVAAVHIEYMRNMNITASMSTRILQGDRLWGLISCHHRTAKYLSYQTCSLFELLSDMISAKIASLNHRRQAAFKTDMHQLYTKVVESIYKEGSLQRGVAKQQQQLLELLRAEGIAVVYEKEIQTFGTTPQPSEIEDLVFWLQSKDVAELFTVSGLSDQYEHADAYVADASGLLVLPIHPGKGHFILAFRPEAIRKVNWGGNPDEAINFTPDGKNYHPRNSFQLWQQTVKKQAIPWRAEELEMAESFKNFVLAYTLQKM